MMLVVWQSRVRAPLVWLFFATFAMLSALLGAVPISVLGEGPTRLLIEPSTPSVAVGEEVTLTVRVAEVTNLYGIDLRLGFDADVLEIVDMDSAKEGFQSTPGNYPYPDLVARNEADNDAGSTWYMVTQLGAREAASGQGTVVTMRLRALVPGTGAITVRQADLASNEGFMIPVETGDAAIKVTEVAVDGEGDGKARAGSDPAPFITAAVGVAVVGAVGVLMATRRWRRA